MLTDAGWYAEVKESREGREVEGSSRRQKSSQGEGGISQCLVARRGCVGDGLAHITAPKGVRGFSTRASEQSLSLRVDRLIREKIILIAQQRSHSSIFSLSFVSPPFACSDTPTVLKCSPSRAERYDPCCRSFLRIKSTVIQYVPRSFSTSSFKCRGIASYCASAYARYHLSC